MNALNQVILEGNVIRAPQSKETPNGKRVCTLPIAVNRIFKDNTGNEVKEVGYYDVEAWGEKFTERVEKYGLKGRGVRVVGRLKQNRWKDSDGKQRSSIFVVAEHVDFKPVFNKKSDQDAEGSSPEDEDSGAEETNLTGLPEGPAEEEAVY